MVNNQKMQMKDMVVVLPGITGSVLTKDGKDIWGASKEALSKIVFSGGDVLQELKLEREDALQDAAISALKSVGSVGIG